MDNLSAPAIQAIIVAGVVGLVEVLKIAGLPTKFAPIIAILLGIGGYFLMPGGMMVREIVFYGILSGLSAAGLYSSVKKMAE